MNKAELIEKIEWLIQECGEDYGDITAQFGPRLPWTIRNYVIEQPNYNAFDASPSQYLFLHETVAYASGLLTVLELVKNG